jgi:NADPH:quinone reductase-like Zn-dependent oxidoreductase
MRQVWIPRVGGPEVLEVREGKDPEPGEGQVRVRVHAAGVNFADCMARIGLYPDAPKLPTVVGYEVAGVVDKLGPGVTAPAVGARVLAMTRFGGYSEAVVVPVHMAVPMPDDLTFEQGAAIPVNYLTAWAMLVWLGNAHAGEKVLVHAAAGGVGQAALQICKIRGAEVIGTASKSKHARLRELGVAHTIDYTTEDFEVEVKRITGGRGVDIVLDAVGGESFAKSYRSLAPLGRMYVFGGSGFAPKGTRNLFSVLKAFLALPTFKPMTLMSENRGVHGVNMGHMWGETQKLRGMLDDIMAEVRAKRLTPVVDKTFPFAKAGDAHRFIQDRKNFGKVLLLP